MASLVFVLAHSTDEPDRAATALQTALDAARAGNDVALWLTGEGVRLGVEGVAETLREPTPTSAAEMIEALADGGAVLYCHQGSFERRKFEAEALRNGAQVAAGDVLAKLVSEGAHSITL